MVTTEPAARDLLVGAVFGVGGAWVSILERAQRLTLKPFEPPSYFAFQGATRIILGAVFGVFIVIVLKAGLVLTILHDTSWGLACAAFVAGASERLVPEMVRSIEGTYSAE